MSPKLPRALTAVVFAMALTSCGSTDKTGADQPAQTQTLRLATRTHGDGPGAAFAAEASGETLKITIENDAHRDLGRASDEAILADVVSGAVDLGVISVESLEAVGVRSFDPLVAPGVVTTIDAEAQIAGGPLATQMLEGAAAAAVVGLAIVPGPIHYLVGLGEPIVDSNQLRGQAFGLTATSTLAADVIDGLGAVVKLDDRADTIDTNVRGLDTSPQGISQRQIVDIAGHLVGNMPLWPQPTIIVANTQRFRALTAAQQETLVRAGLQSAATQAAAVIKDDSEALAVLCRSSAWTVAAVADDVEASINAVLAEVTDRVRADPELDRVLGEIEQLGSGMSAPTALTCPAGGTTEPTSTQPPGFTGAAAALVGSWEADVTDEALADAGVGPSENGLIGHWSMTINENGRIVFEGPGATIDAAVGVEGDALTVTIDTGSAEEGLGEVWHYSWSVFRDKLTLERLPAPEYQAGPTFLVSQPFERA